MQVQVVHFEMQQRPCSMRWHVCFAGEIYEITCGLVLHNKRCQSSVEIRHPLYNLVADRINPPASRSAWETQASLSKETCLSISSSNKDSYYYT